MFKGCAGFPQIRLAITAAHHHHHLICCQVSPIPPTSQCLHHITTEQHPEKNHTSDTSSSLPLSRNIHVSLFLPPSIAQCTLGLQYKAIYLATSFRSFLFFSPKLLNTSRPLMMESIGILSFQLRLVVPSGGECVSRCGVRRLIELQRCPDSCRLRVSVEALVVMSNSC